MTAFLILTTPTKHASVMSGFCCWLALFSDKLLHLLYLSCPNYKMACISSEDLHEAEMKEPSGRTIDGQKEEVFVGVVCVLCTEVERTCTSRG